MQYSPKLKKAAEEIKEILAKYDIAAEVSLHTPGFSEYILKLNPSYSCVSLSNGGVRFKAKKEDYPDEKQRIKVMTDSTNMLHLLSNTVGTNAVNLIAISDAIDELLNADHTDGGHTSHEQQNN